MKLPWALDYIWRPCLDKSGNISITELLKIGKEIGLEGADLKEFITTQQEEEIRTAEGKRASTRRSGKRKRTA